MAEEHGHVFQAYPLKAQGNCKRVAVAMRVRALHAGFRE
jgi:hypothetical protein